MNRGRLALTIAVAAVAVSLCAAGLVSAQQDAPAATPAAVPPQTKTPPAPVSAAAPSSAAPTPAAPVVAPEPEVQPTAPVDEASDDSEADAPSAAPKPIDQAKRPRYAVAILQVLDKVSAETMRFEAPINQPIRYKSLIFVVRACETNAPDEPVREAAAHIEIISQPPGPDGAPPPPGKRVFRGWMFANAPGLDLFEHPVYDAWLIACKTAAPST